MILGVQFRVRHVLLMSITSIELRFSITFFRNSEGFVSENSSKKCFYEDINLFKHLVNALPSFRSEHSGLLAFFHSSVSSVRINLHIWHLDSLHQPFEGGVVSFHALLDFSQPNSSDVPFR